MLIVKTGGIVCKRILPPVMGYARRKPYAGNPHVRFDEELEVERPLAYSTKTMGACASFE